MDNLCFHSVLNFTFNLDYRKSICFQSIILIDGEGTPVQEFAAIEVNRKTHVIMDVFHNYARTEEQDTYARHRVHGLNKDYLNTYGYASEADLVEAFKSWLSSKPYITLFANGANREAKMLGLPVCEFNLAPWAERDSFASHKIAKYYKDQSLPICGRSCTQQAHSSFLSAIQSPNVLTSLAKARHGFHCALYDCVELYFQSIMF